MEKFLQDLRFALRVYAKNFADEPREIVGVVEDTLGNTLSETAAPGIFSQVLPHHGFSKSDCAAQLGGASDG